MHPLLRHLYRALLSASIAAFVAYGQDIQAGIRLEATSHNGTLVLHASGISGVTAVSFFAGGRLVGAAPVRSGTAELTLPAGGGGRTTFRASAGASWATTTWTPPGVRNGKPNPGRTLDGVRSGTTIESGDFDGDGVTDLAFIRSDGSGLTVVTRAGARNIPIPDNELTSLVTVDWNRDGLPDLVVAGSSSSIFILLSQKGLGPVVASAEALRTRPDLLSVSDFNHDGRADLATVDRQSRSVTIWLGQSDGQLSEQPATVLNDEPLFLVAADFNGDGNPDLAVGGRAGLQILDGDGTGALALDPNRARLGDPISRMLAEDFNGDGITDLALVRNDRLTILTGGASGWTEARGESLPGVDALAWADLDGDGIGDLVLLRSGDNAVAVLAGDGAGSFRPSATVAAARGTQLAAGDWNGDGRADLAVADSDGVRILDGAPAVATAAESKAGAANGAAPGALLKTAAARISATVSSNADSGPGTLREALKSADSIDFSIANTTIKLTSGPLVINGQVLIEGSGTNITIDGNNQSRIFQINGPATGTVTIRGLRLINGLAKGGRGADGLGGGGGAAGLGGAAFVYSGNDVRFENVTFENNWAQGGNGGSVAEGNAGISPTGAGGGGGGGMGGDGGGASTGPLFSFQADHGGNGGAGYFGEVGGVGGYQTQIDTADIISMASSFLQANTALQILDGGGRMGYLTGKAAITSIGVSLVKKLINTYTDDALKRVILDNWPGNGDNFGSGGGGGGAGQMYGSPGAFGGGGGSGYFSPVGLAMYPSDFAHAVTGGASAFGGGQGGGWVTNGAGIGGDGYGGALFVYAGNVTCSGCVFNGNAASGGASGQGAYGSSAVYSSSSAGAAVYAHTGATLDFPVAALPTFSRNSSASDKDVAGTGTIVLDGAAPNETYVFNDQNDGFGSLRWALATNPAGTIRVASTMQGRTIVLSNELVLTGASIVNTIPNVTISGGNTTRIFRVVSGTNSIGGLTLANGYAKGGDGGSSNFGGGGGAGMGGAIFVAAGSLSINGVTFLNNKAQGGGGGYTSGALYSVQRIGGGGGGSIFGSAPGVGATDETGGDGASGLNTGGQGGGKSGNPPPYGSNGANGANYAGGGGGASGSMIFGGSQVRQGGNGGDGDYGAGGGGAGYSICPVASFPPTGCNQSVNTARGGAGGFGGGGGAGYVGGSGLFGGAGGQSTRYAVGGGGAGLGGALFVANTAQATIAGSTFAGNSAAGGGGGNTGQGKGGAIFAHGAITWGAPSTFTSNSATSAAGTPTDSGDIFGTTVNGTPAVITLTSSSVAAGLALAIAGAPSGSVLQFDSSLSGTTISVPNEIVLNKDLIIDGALGGSHNLTFAGAGAFRLFCVTNGASVQFRNLTLTGGGGAGSTGACSTANRAGAVYMASGTVRLTNVSVTGHGTAGGTAGAIYAASGSLSLASSRFSGNVAPDIRLEAGASFTHANNNWFAGGSVSSSSVVSAATGAAVTARSAETITVTSSAAQGPGTLFEVAHQAPSGSTIVFDVGNSQTITPFDEIYIGGDLTIDGGLANVTISGGDSHRILFLQGGSAGASRVVIRNLALTHGMAKGGDGGTTNAAGSGGGGAGMGGAIFVNAGSLTLSSVIFDSNHATGGAGGRVLSTDSNIDTNPDYSRHGAGGGGASGAGATVQPGALSPGNGGSGGYLVLESGGAGGRAGGAGTGANGADGGFGGGGGGGGNGQTQGGNGGNGGFGGGAGSRGGGPGSAHGTPGAYGGAASSGQAGPGAGLGGALFLRAGTATLTGVSFNNNDAARGQQDLNYGSESGRAMFANTGASITALTPTPIVPSNLTNLVTGTYYVPTSLSPLTSVTTTAGRPFPTVNVTVRDQNGAVMVNVPVTFTFPGSGPSVDGPPVVVVNSNAAGIAALNVNANSVLGSFIGVASVGTITSSMSMTITAPNAIAAATAVSGTPQSAEVQSAFSTPLLVLVQDNRGNPVPYAPVRFQCCFTSSAGLNPVVSGASGSFTGGATSLTVTSGFDGTASVTFTANSSPGTYRVVAGAADLSGYTSFVLTNTSSPKSVVAAGGSAQNALLGAAFAAPLQAQVLDGAGNGVSGVPVTFIAPDPTIGTGASGTFANGARTATATTGASGVAISPAFTANAKTGAYAVAAFVTGIDNPAAFNLVNLASSPATIGVVAGTPQSTAIQTAFSSALEIVVRDKNGNGVTGQTVTFTAPATSLPTALFPGGVTTVDVVTNSLGQAYVNATAGNLAGTYTVMATVAGSATQASFVLTNLKSSPTSIAVSRGTPGTAAVGSAFPSLDAVVRDAGGNAISGVVVTFAVPSSGAYGVFTGGVTTTTATTNSDGIASASITAAGATGSYTVTANTSGVAGSALFQLTNVTGPPAAISPSAGSPQSAAQGAAFSVALKARVVDAGGNGISNQAVRFSAPGGSGAGGSFSGATYFDARTDSNGYAIAGTFTANSVAGSYSVTATVNSLTTTFALTNTAGTAASVAFVDGTGQSATFSSAFAAPLKVRVLDSATNPVSGATVTFTAPTSGARLTFAGGQSSATATTDSTGVATSPAMTAGTVAGAFIVTASTGGRTATASMTAASGSPSTIELQSGSPQSTGSATAFASPLAVLLRDSAGNAVGAGFAVTFTAPAGGASATFSNSTNTITVNTNAYGVASVPVSANAALGAYTVAAGAAGVTGSGNFSLTNVLGSPSLLTTAAGSPQSAAVQTAFSTALRARLTDAGSNPISGQTITFTAPASGASGTFTGNSLTATAVTDASGYATASAFTANTTSGAYSVTATGPGSTSATFSLTNVAGAAAALAVSAGASQTAVVSTAFGTALQVRATDASSNPVPGLQVTFSAPTSGARLVFQGGLSSATATTNASGLATAPAMTAGPTTGDFNVTATAGALSTTAGMTVVGGTPASIAVVSGSGQSATVNTAYSAPLVVVVRDGVGNGTGAGVQVTFTAPASGASGAFAGATYVATALTDKTGQATSPVFTANATSGAFAVSASVAGVGTSASFSLTNNVGVPSTVTILNGSPQVTKQGTNFQTALSVRVQDAGGNNVPNNAVTFTTPASAATALFGASHTATVNTDASGVATAPTLTASSTTGSYTVVASTTNNVTTSFALTNSTTGAAVLSVSSGDGQTATVGTTFGSALQVLVKDSGSNPVSGVTVTFTAPASGATVTFAGSGSTATAVTDASGLATSPAMTAGTTSGTIAISASVTGGLSTAASLAALPGAASSIAIYSGNNQSVGVSTAATQPLSVIVKDTYGNGVPGIRVLWIAPSYGASLTFANSSVQTTLTTGANGIASAAFTANDQLGAYQVQTQSPDMVGAFFFNLTNVAAGPANVVVTPYTVRVLKTITSMMVQITDPSGNPIRNRNVTFTAPASGPSGTFSGNSRTATVATDLSGYATPPTFTANSTVGTYQIAITVANSTLTGAIPVTNLNTGVVGTITAVSGTPQSAAEGTLFPSTLKVQVQDTAGNLMSNQTVNFGVVPNGNAQCTLASGSSSTDANGYAEVQATAGSVVGTYQVLAYAPGGSANATFSLTNLTGPAAAMTVQSGSGQSAAINGSFSAVTVRVADSGDNPVNNAVVTFMLPTSGARAVFPGRLSTATATTNSSGVATSPAITAATVPGTFSLTAATGAATGSATLTVVPGPAATITVSAGSPQSAAVTQAFGTALKVEVRDAGGNLVASGVPITFSAPASGASGKFANNSTTVVANTDSSGIAQASAFTANSTVGSYNVTASRSGAASASFQLTNTLGTPASVTAQAGGGQSASISTVFAIPLQATVKDAGGNVLSGVTVTFTAPASGASGAFAGGTNTVTATTDAAGVATAPAFTANNTTGSYSIAASVNGVGTQAAFSMTNAAGAPASIAVSGGSGQSATVNSAYGTALQAVVRDAQNNPAAGVTVTFALPGSGASGTFAAGNTATTNASGVATATPLTANGTAGAFQISATAPGVANPAVFSLTNLAGSAAAVTAVAGSGQSAPVGSAFGTVLQARVTDSGGNPLPNIAVTFAAPGSGATGSFASGATATTNASGIATAPPFTANTVSGSYAVTASAPAAATAATFSLTNSPGAPATATAVSGASQSAQVLNAYATALQVLVKDVYGNPTAGVSVTFNAPASGASVTFVGGANAATDSAGIATVAVTANATIGSFNATATAAGVGTPAAFSLTNTVGAPATLAIISGTPQSALVGNAFASRLVVQLRDAGNNPVPNAPVTFNAPATGASALFGAAATVTTDASGVATSPAVTANSASGSYTVTASATGAAVTPAAFALTNVALTSVTVTASVPGLRFSVDGQAYTSAQTFQWAPGSIHTLATDADQYNADGNAEYAFTSWSQGGAISQQYTTPSVSPSAPLTAAFHGVRFQLLAVPSTASAGSIRSNGAALPPAIQWVAAGTVLSLEADPATGCAFSQWTWGSVSPGTATSSNPLSVTMDGPKSLVANFSASTPVLTLSVVGKSLVAGVSTWTVRVANSGTGAPANARIVSVTTNPSTTVITPLPLDLGAIPPGGSAQATFSFAVPSTVPFSAVVTLYDGSNTKNVSFSNLRN